MLNTYRILNLALRNADAALNDHPEGSTVEDLADFVIDQVCDATGLTESEWSLARTPLFRKLVVKLVRDAQSPARQEAWRLDAGEALHRAQN